MLSATALNLIWSGSWHKSAIEGDEEKGDRSTETDERHGAHLEVANFA
jgi:hypothetical protein